MQIFSLIGEFKNFCLKTTQEIIDQFSLPKYLQEYDKYLKLQNGLFFENHRKETISMEGKPKIMPFLKPIDYQYLNNGNKKIGVRF